METMNNETSPELRVVWRGSAAAFAFLWEIRLPTGDLLQSPEAFRTRHDAMGAGKRVMATLMAGDPWIRSTA
jgi:hypothetical protein